MLRNVTGNLSHCLGAGQIVAVSTANESCNLRLSGGQIIHFTGLNVGNQEKVFWADLCR
jgi:hypothetical protein